MKKTFSLLFIFCTSLFSQSFTLHNGWQLLGATEDINTSAFDDSCANFIWGYDTSNPSLPLWRVHIANDQSYTIPSTIGTLDMIKIGDGFWVMSSGECGVETNNNSTNFKFTKDWLNGKTLYYVGYDDFGYDDIGKKWNLASMSFTQDTLVWQEYNTPDTTPDSVNYTITSEGWIDVLTEEEGFDPIKPIILTEDYVKICFLNECNTTDPLNQEYLFFDFQKAKDFVDAKNAE